MPIYRAGKARWRVTIWSEGKRQDWIVNGSKADAEAFEARLRIEIERPRSSRAARRAEVLRLLDE